MPSVLIVEDDSKTAHSLVAGLRAEGFEARALLRGDDALRALAGTDGPPCDLVVLDLMLPGCGGLEVLRRDTRARPAGAGPPAHRPRRSP